MRESGRRGVVVNLQMLRDGEIVGRWRQRIWINVDSFEVPFHHRSVRCLLIFPKAAPKWSAKEYLSRSISFNSFRVSNFSFTSSHTHSLVSKPPRNVWIWTTCCTQKQEIDLCCIHSFWYEFYVLLLMMTASTNVDVFACEWHIWIEFITRA